MSSVRIVTDSSAQFLDPAFVLQHNIAIIPASIRFGHEVLRDGVQLDPEGFFRRILTEGCPPPTLEAPSVENYQQVLADLAQTADHIVVLPMASGLSASYQNALAAADSLRPRSEITVVDTMTTSVGLAFLAETAVTAAATTGSVETVVRRVRSAVPRIYSVFYVETLDYLFRANLIGEAQSILGKILGIKPFLTIEDGRLVTMEKVRTRLQAVDKLLEFVMEFAAIDQLVIVQNTPHITDQTRLILERLALEFAGREFPVIMYGPTMGTHLGPDGVGIIVFESDGDE